jgi:hypothetical protein
LWDSADRTSSRELRDTTFGCSIPVDLRVCLETKPL